MAYYYRTQEPRSITLQKCCLEMAQTNRNGNLSLFKLNCIQISNESYFRQRKVLLKIPILLEKYKIRKAPLALFPAI
jgi:hypothetical protein